jgi:hypothetical protein
MHYRGSTYEEEEEPAPSSTRVTPGRLDTPGGFCVVSLNIGGRHTNPAEFVLEGDDSEVGTVSAALGAQLFQAMSSDTVGPGALAAHERKAADSFLAELALLSRRQGSDGEVVASLMDQPTWARVYDLVRRDNPGLFNALNLATLQLGRPSVLEAPESCRAYRDPLDYVAGWRAWYMEIDRAGRFWTEEAPTKARKHGLTVGTAFSGLFLFDLLCLQATQACFGRSPFRDVRRKAQCGGALLPQHGRIDNLCAGGPGALRLPGYYCTVQVLSGRA